MAVRLKKQDCGGDADPLVAVDEGMIPRHAVHQHRRLSKDVGIELVVAKSSLWPREGGLHFGAGHFLAEEAPDAVLRLAEPFLAET